MGGGWPPHRMRGERETLVAASFSRACRPAGQLDWQAGRALWHDAPGRRLAKHSSDCPARAYMGLGWRRSGGCRCSPSSRGPAGV